MGILNILTIILVIAKLIGIVNFSWFVVLLPTIISIVVKTILVVGAIILSIWANS